MKSVTTKGLVRASILVAGATVLQMPGEARAQTVFSTIQAFGDSYADTGNLFKAIGPSPLYPTGRFSGGTNFVDTTSQLWAFRKSTLRLAAPRSRRVRSPTRDLRRSRRRSWLLE